MSRRAETAAAAAGRARRRRGALLSAVLGVAVILASTPLSLLIADLDWLRAAALAAATVCGVGVLGRLALRPTILLPLLQGGALALLVLAVEMHGGILPTGGPADLLRGQVPLVTEGFTALTMEVPPVALGAEARAVLILLVGVVVLALDVLCAEGGWWGVSAVLLLCFQLVPALMHPEGAPWYVIAGPTLGALLVLGAGASHGRFDGRRAAVGVLCALLVAGAAPQVAAVLPTPARPALPLDIGSVTGQGSTQPLGPTMIDDSISVRRDLLQAEETTVLTYATDAPTPDYLRLRTLREFTGEEFVEGALAGEDPMPFTGGFSSTSEIRISGLVSDRLPVPAGQEFTGMVLHGGESEALMIQSGSVALAGAPRDLSGWQYEISGAAQEPAPEQLRGIDVQAAGAELPRGYLDIEAPDEVGALAEQIVGEAGASGGYDSARALEDYFHGFAYSVTARTPRGADPIQSFLDDRVGYCEQFAGTFALMMNHLGYPTRVSIGFTAGQSTGTSNVVTNRNAHAWPEVYFGPEVGWVRFEPTPATSGNGIAPPPIAPEDPGEEIPVTAPEAESLSPTTAPVSPSAAPSATAIPATEDPRSSAAQLERGALIGLAVALAAAALIGAAVLGRRRAARRREEGWEEIAVRGGGAQASRASAESARRAAGLLAWSEVQEHMRRRDRRIRLLGWTGAWGRPPRALRLDPSRPPAAAMEGLLRDAGADPAAPVHRAGARVADAVADARYAPEPAVCGAVDVGAVDGGPADPAGPAAAASAGSGADVVASLRQDADDLLALLRERRRP
ncbi:transglutaminaseTgpA domain-containing protein [Brachybacterium sp. JHP9]|uniref:TransglutaminaseTgpA domain-containing protein n=1 Tax=Brachybacterium equifaecis TaxID=2910770 RepID=A0ABT0QZM0_9MICO|nr:DUF3488 and transglutaminase-like domain-containing protein [Brachybacterium equifaecis]MCL6423103.1 transglutaminaseTgpA domain-containing protein [Brachybacterium equifaecis]